MRRQVGSAEGALWGDLTLTSVARASPWKALRAAEHSWREGKRGGGALSSSRQCFCDGGRGWCMMMLMVFGCSVIVMLVACAFETCKCGAVTFDAVWMRSGSPTCHLCGGSAPGTDPAVHVAHRHLQ